MRLVELYWKLSLLSTAIPLSWLILLSDSQPSPKGLSVLLFSWNWIFSFFGKFCLQNGENRSTTGLFECIWKFSQYFFLNWSIMKVLYWLLYAWTSLIFGKVSLAEIWVKMLFANKIAGFLNQIYLQYKFFFCMLIEIHVDKNIGVGKVINGCAQSDCRTQKLAVSHQEIKGINWFFMCWYKLRKLEMTLLIGFLPYRGSYKINIVCLAVCPSTNLAFFSGMAH